MSVVACGNVQLAIDRAGEGSPLVLIHGSWANRRTWDPVFPALARRFDVIRYDRRGYGESERPGCGMSAHVNDALELIRALNLNNVLLVGNSFGGVVAAGAALAAPELISQVIIHEPPLFDLLDVHPKDQAISVRTRSALNSAVEAARARDAARAAQIYVERMSGAPGAWPYLPPAVQQAFIENADGFTTDADPAGLLELRIADLQQLGGKLVVTRGARTAAFLKIIANVLCTALHNARSHVFPNAGHVPHETCPEEFTGAILNLAALYQA